MCSVTEQAKTTANQSARRTLVIAHHRPHRLVVRTSRRGRDNPGSTPGEDICVVCWSKIS